LCSVPTFGQGLAPVVKPDSKDDKRSAQALYEEANGYLGRKYQEFNKQKVPYDPKIEAETKKEQHESCRQKRSDSSGTFISKSRRSLLPRSPSSSCGRR
jgi:hypothetical protein